jgi:hypothetical protein
MANKECFTLYILRNINIYTYAYLNTHTYAYLNINIMIKVRWPIRYSSPYIFSNWDGRDDYH